MRCDVLQPKNQNRGTTLLYHSTNALTYHPTIDNGRIYAAELCSVYCTEGRFSEYRADIHLR